MKIDASTRRTSEVIGYFMDLNTKNRAMPLNICKDLNAKYRNKTICNSGVPSKTLAFTADAE
ncbi:hypothetical protein AGMMS49593_04320 [Endomicrobiia bacterium]|nr:hypothetical protein AGMMS49593_04320 [Endomicrobiia bacterium]